MERRMASGSRLRGSGGSRRAGSSIRYSSYTARPGQAAALTCHPRRAVQLNKHAKLRHALHSAPHHLEREGMGRKEGEDC